MTDAPQSFVQQVPVYNPAASHGSQIVHPSLVKPITKMLFKNPKMKMHKLPKRTPVPHRKRRRLY